MLEAEAAYTRAFPDFPEDGKAAPHIKTLPLRKEFIMPVSAEDVRTTLRRIPARYLEGLKAVFLLGGTRKQNRSAWGYSLSYGCYWEDCVFLHPFPKDLLRATYPRAPKPSELLYFRRIGATITTTSEGTTIRFDRDSLKRLYLYDVFIHEIGHHVDRHNPGNENEKEAFAEWFATEFGFRRRRQREVAAASCRRSK